MNWLHPIAHTDDWRRPPDPYYRPLQRDVLDARTAESLFRLVYQRDNPHVPTDPPATRADEDHYVGGLIDAGLLVRTEDGVLTLSEEVLYSLRLTDSDDITAY
ncbi:hypothetical protein [Streptomyces sp. NPDC046685]|uniref:hypothetical protein n=1 Tax=Streptomyces sp. NPDC046685 TaxID=3157202 RepID=UPI0033DFC96E